MGVSVREKEPGSGVWWIFLHHNGKRRSKKIGAEKEARDVAAKIEAKIILGELDIDKSEKEKICFGEYSKKYLAFIKMNRRNSTHERYSQVLRDHVSPTFKNKPVDSIKRGEIRDLLIKKAETMDVRIIRDVISGVMGYAVDDEIIQANPVIGIIKKLNLKKDEIEDNDETEDVDPLTETELHAFLGKADETVPAYYPFFLTAARTGMRLGELLALRWGDLQFNNPVILPDGKTENRPFIWVKRSYRRGIITKPKNGKTRKVDMSNQLTSVLKDHQAKEKRNAFKQGKEMPELLFHRQGKIMEQNYIRRIFKRILSKAELREIKFHGLRHTFASLLLSKGESPVYVKEQLGHSSIQITVDIYGKWINTTRMVGVNHLDTPHLTAPICTLQNKKAVTN